VHGRSLQPGRRLGGQQAEELAVLVAGTNNARDLEASPGDQRFDLALREQMKTVLGEIPAGQRVLAGRVIRRPRLDEPSPCARQ
jgi:hypothetical protein